MAPPAPPEAARAERTVEEFLCLGPWTLGAPLSVGSCGVVFEATRVGDGGPPVALHVPFARLQSDATFREAYLQDAAASMSFQLPGLCPTLDGGSNGVVWRVMPLIEGWSLGALITRARGRGQGLSFAFALSVCEEVGDTLAGLAEARSAHGRLSPSRVLITPDGGVVLCGWTTPNLGPRPSALLNNPTAMAELAPERLDGLNASAATDVYHLALLLVTVLSRGNPLQRVSAERVQRAILSEELALPESLSGPLCAIVERSLRRDHGERPTLNELRAALRAAASDLPPFGPAERLTELQSLTQGLSAPSSPAARAAAESEAVALLELLRGPAGQVPVTLLSAGPKPGAAGAVTAVNAVNAVAPAPEVTPPPVVRPSFVIAAALIILLSMGVGALMSHQLQRAPETPAAQVVAPPPAEPPAEPPVEVAAPAEPP
ncbi:protein kinase, partial [Myxococcota bacterium]|nr:protein kinase [Myxococcota bacterium]